MLDKNTQDTLETILDKFNTLAKELESPELANDIKKMTAISKEKGSLEALVSKYLEYKTHIENLKLAKESFLDKEIGSMAKEEAKEIEELIPGIIDELRTLLIPSDPNDDKNVIVEVRGAAGGDEANIFCGDLYKMYSRYAEMKSFKIELLSAQEATSGGYSQVSFILKGDKAYSNLKFESGTHRVQRVPKTESQGRVHTSTATVVVLPEVEAVDVEIKTSDLRIDTFRSSGAGGQHVNTTDSAIRITHIPTGVVTQSQDGRSQHDNKDKAMKMLLAKIYEKKQQEQTEQNDSARKLAVGTGARAEKIRTYNYPQNRVTDHRIGLSLNKLEQVMNGNLDEIINSLLSFEQETKMKDMNK